MKLITIKDKGTILISISEKRQINYNSLLITKTKCQKIIKYLQF